MSPFPSQQKSQQPLLMRGYWDIPECIFDISLQDDAIPTCPDDHLQYVLEPSVSHLPRAVRDMVVDRATNRVRKVMNFPPAPVVLRHKAQGGRDKRQGWIGDFFHPYGTRILLITGSRLIR